MKEETNPHDVVTSRKVIHIDARNQRITAIPFDSNLNLIDEPGQDLNDFGLTIPKTMRRAWKAEEWERVTTAKSDFHDFGFVIRWIEPNQKYEVDRYQKAVVLGSAYVEGIVEDSFERISIDTGLDPSDFVVTSEYFPGKFSIQWV